jgi:hypothetical protein
MPQYTVLIETNAHILSPVESFEAKTPEEALTIARAHCNVPEWQGQWIQVVQVVERFKVGGG